MRKIIIVLLSAIVVFLATMLVTDSYMSNQAEESATELNNRLIDDFKNDFNQELVRTESAVHSFLTGIFWCRYDSLHQSEPRFYLSDNDLPIFISEITHGMVDFLHINPNFVNAVFMVDDSVSLANQKYGLDEGFIISMSQNNRIAQRINYDFMHADSYNRLKIEQQCIWTLPSSNSALNKKIAIYYVPIFCENDSFLGAFCINLDISYIREKILQYLPYGQAHSELMVYDQKGRFVATYPPKYEEFDSIQAIPSDLSNNALLTHLDTISEQHFSVFDGEKYYLYKRQIPSSKWNVLTACRENDIYKDVYETRWMILLTSFFGMLLMLACCLVIFRQVRKDLAMKAIAENEIQMAAKVQQHILKEPILEKDSFKLEAYIKPAHDAGGDLYCYQEIDEKLVFCIGDVSGKGMPAALFMTQVVSLFNDIIRHTLNPASIVCEINDVLAENNPDMAFCTFFLGVLDGNQLTFCNAGHNPPVILKTEKDATFLKPRPNLALGLMEDYPYLMETMELEPNDSLILYTDGVTEAKNINHQDFGEKCLIQALNHRDSCAHAIQSVLNEVLSFVGKAEQSDDITLVKITYKG